MKAHPTIPNAFFDNVGAFMFDSKGRLYEVRLSRKLFHANPWNTRQWLSETGYDSVKAPTFNTLALLVAKR